MASHPRIRFIRPLIESPKVCEVAEATAPQLLKRSIDPGKANLIGADDSEYVYFTFDDELWSILEVITGPDGEVSLRSVPSDRTQAVFKAAIEAWQAGKPAPSN
jgi:hypothetical protein